MQSSFSSERKMANYLPEVASWKLFKLPSLHDVAGDAVAALPTEACCYERLVVSVVGALLFFRCQSCKVLELPVL